VNDWEKEREREEAEAREMLKPLIKAMRKGGEEWVRCWTMDGLLTQNIFTGRKYRGFNVLLITCFKYNNGYKLNQWLTELQGEALGWRLKKEAPSCKIVYPARFANEGYEFDSETGKPKRDRMGNLMRTGSSPTQFKFAKIYNVSEFVEGPYPRRTIKQMIFKVKSAPKVSTDDLDRISMAQKLCEEWDRKQCKASFESPSAYYRPSEDVIAMPPLPNFDTMDDFYSTWLHEIIHSTGHHYRLGRPSLTTWGTDAYAREELVAELGSFLLCQKLGLATSVGQHAAYLSGWAKSLEDDPRVIFKVLKESNEAIYLIRRNAGFPLLGACRDKFDERDSGRKRELGPVRHSRLPAFESSKAFALA
jgi:antirestriction protein ArdC